MVSRVELLAAQSEARASKDEVQAKLGELTRMQAQLNDARYEAAQLKAAMSGMMTRAEAEQEKQHWQEVEAALKADLQAARLAALSLNEKIGALEGDKSKLVARIQASPLARACPMRGPACDAMRAPPQGMVPRAELHDARCGRAAAARAPSPDAVLSRSRAVAAGTMRRRCWCSWRTSRPRGGSGPRRRAYPPRRRSRSS